MTPATASDPGLWWGLAACGPYPKDWFGHPADAFDEPEDAPEERTPDPRAAAVCDRCPVRVECFNWALPQPELYGTWGGTTRFQRRQIHRARERLACPVCRGATTILTGPVQVCAGCGMSWRIY